MPEVKLGLEAVLTYYWRCRDHQGKTHEDITHLYEGNQIPL